MSDLLRLFLRASPRNTLSRHQPIRPFPPLSFGIESCNHPILQAQRWNCSRVRHWGQQGSHPPFVRVAALALSVSGISYGIYNTQPHLLEAPQPDEDFELKEAVFLRYRPVNPPRSLEQADDMLHWQEDSILVGGSIIRSDQVQLPSNLPAEDTMVQAQAKDQQGELVWFISGIFDGHA